jgi:EpsD family peptidyl-prolyl cis-trans isomerase
MKHPHPRSRPRGLLCFAVAMAAAASLLLAGCDEKKKDRVATQAAAKVNDGEITVQQLNFVLQQQRGVKPEQAEAASKQVLERLIDQELARQKAGELKLDHDPHVMQQLDAAQREIIARAYLEKVGEAAAKPQADDIQKYYDAQPALFKQRRIYSLQELAIEAAPQQIPTLKDKLESAKNLNEFVEYLKANDFRYTGNQAVRAAEQLPLGSLNALASLQDGQAIFNASPTGAQVVFLAGSRAQPVSLEQARPAIELFLLNERKRELMAKDMKAMRDAAKIEYLGGFAEGTAAAPGQPSASGPLVAPASPAASGN